MGGKGWYKLRDKSLRIEKTTIHCTVANGYECPPLGKVQVPIEIQNRFELFDILIVPEIEQEVMLGTKFWKKMGVIPDLRSGRWIFSKQPEVEIAAIEARTTLKPEQEQELTTIMDEEFPQLFVDKLGYAKGVTHKIEVDGPPIRQRARPISPALQKHLETELDDMIRKGIVERSNSPWSSPILLVPRKDGKYRFCVDFRRLNNVTRRAGLPSTTPLYRLLSSSSQPHGESEQGH